MDISIDGVNVEKGLATVWGKTKNYIRMLNTYYEDGPEAYQNIESSFNSRDISLYIIHVHGLKSASDVIGAEQLYNDAKMLEEAGIRGDWDYINANNAKLLLALDTLLKNIKAALQKIKP